MADFRKLFFALAVVALLVGAAVNANANPQQVYFDGNLIATFNHVPDGVRIFVRLHAVDGNAVFVVTEDRFVIASYAGGVAYIGNHTSVADKDEQMSFVRELMAYRGRSGFNPRLSQSLSLARTRAAPEFARSLPWKFHGLW